MRKVIAAIQTTLDGYVEGLQGEDAERVDEFHPGSAAWGHRRTTCAGAVTVLPVEDLRVDGSKASGARVPRR